MLGSILFCQQAAVALHRQHPEFLATIQNLLFNKAPRNHNETVCETADYESEELNDDSRDRGFAVELADIGLVITFRNSVQHPDVSRRIVNEDGECEVGFLSR